MSRPIDYLESAVSDRPHSQMDRLLLEYEMDKDPLSGLVQKPQYSMSVPRTPHPEDALPIGGALRLLKGSKHWPGLLKVMAQTSLRNKRKMEVLDEARSIFGKKMDAGGADEATRQYLESKWMEKVIQ